MPDRTALRVDLPPSRLDRRVRRLTQALCAAAVAGCMAAALQPAGVSWLQGAALAMAMLTLAVSLSRRSPASAQDLEVAGDGRIGVRHEDGQISSATVLYCDHAFVCLGQSRRRVPIWRDQLPADAWRRLQVACRWPYRPQQADARSARDARN